MVPHRSHHTISHRPLTLLYPTRRLPAGTVQPVMLAGNYIPDKIMRW